MTDAPAPDPKIPDAISQQVQDFRSSLVNQPEIAQAFDALLPRLINAVVADLDAQADADTKNLPLGSVAAALIKDALNGAGAKAEEEAKAWVDANLGSAT